MRSLPPQIQATVIKRWSELYPGERLLVWVSGGKDAFVCLKLAVDAIGPDRVVPVHRYLVEGIRCVETPIRAQLAMLGIRHPLVLVPGLDTLASMMRGTYCKVEVASPKGPPRQVKFTDIEALARRRTGVTWTAGGEKEIDTVMRRLWLRQLDDGIDHAQKRLFPVRLWSHHHVRAFCLMHRAPLSPNFGGEISSGLGFEVLDQVKARYPDDYARIIAAFPFAEALLERDKIYGKRPRTPAQKRALEAAASGRPDQVPDGRRRARQPRRDQAGGVQPTPGQQGSQAADARKPQVGRPRRTGFGVEPPNR